MPGIVDKLTYVLSLDTAGFTGEARQADSATNVLANSISGTLTNAVAGIAAAFSLVKLFEFGRDSAFAAARNEVLGTVLDNVGRTANLSAVAMDAYTQRIRALGITTQEALQTQIRFIQGQLKMDDALRLARVAQDAATIAQINSSEALDRLLRGIQRGDTELLRSVGIFVSIESTLRKFAESTGKSRDALTDLERQTAIMNAVFEQGDRIAGNYEAAMKNVGKQMTSLPRLFEESQVTIGERFNGTLQKSVNLMTDFLVGLREFLATSEQIATEKAFKSEESFLRLQQTLPPLISQFQELAKEQKAGQIVSLSLVNIQERIAAIAPSLISGYTREGVAIGLTTDRLGEFLDKKKDEAIFAKGVAANEIAESYDEIQKQLTKAKDRQQELTTEVGKSGDAFTSLQSILSDPLKEFAEGTKSADDELREVNKTIDTLEAKLRKLKATEATLFDKTVAQLENDTRISIDFDIEPEPVELKDVSVLIAQITGDLEVLRRKKEEVRRTPLAGDDPSIQLFLDMIEKMSDRAKLKLELGLISSVEFAADIEKLKQLMIDKFGEVPLEFQKIFKDALDGVADKSKETAGDIVSAFGGASAAFVRLFDSAAGQIADKLSSAIQGAISGISTGGIAGAFTAVSSILSSIFSLFDKDEKNTDRLVATERDLIRAIESWQETVMSLSASDKEDQRQVAQTIIDSITQRPGVDASGRPTGRRGILESGFSDEQIRAMFEDVGIDIPAGITLSQILVIAEGILGGIQHTNELTQDILAADTPAERLAAISSAKTADEALQVLRELSQLFELSPEETAALLESILAGFPDISNRTLLDIKGELEDIKRGQADSRDLAEQTQTSRSIARVTERQADSLIAIMQTVDLHLVQFLGSISDGIGELIDRLSSNVFPAIAGVTGDVIFTGDIIVNDSSGNANTIAKRLVGEFNRELRAAGTTRRS